MTRRKTKTKGDNVRRKKEYFNDKMWIPNSLNVPNRENWIKSFCWYSVDAVIFFGSPSHIIHKRARTPAFQNRFGNKSKLFYPAAAAAIPILYSSNGIFRFLVENEQGKKERETQETHFLRLLMRDVSKCIRRNIYIRCCQKYSIGYGTRWKQFIHATSYIRQTYKHRYTYTHTNRFKRHPHVNIESPDGLKRWIWL